MFESDGASVDDHVRTVLKCPPMVASIGFVGVSGAVVRPTVFHKCLTVPEVARHIGNGDTAVILDIGGNDITLSDATSYTVARDIVRFAQQLISDLAVCMVKVCTILPRDKVRGSMTADQFRASAQEVNLLLSGMVEDQSRISVYRHEGFWRDANLQEVNTSKWSNDGVHPNKEEGIKLYRKNMRSCLHHLVRDYKKTLPSGPQPRR